MPDRHNMAKTMMIDIPPEVLESTIRPRVKSVSKGKRIVIRRPGQKIPSTTGSKPVLSGDVITFFEGVYDAALITDTQGSILEANVRAIQFFGYTREELRETSIGEIILGLDSKILQTIAANLRNNQFTLLQTGCQRSDGTMFPSEVSTSQMRLTGKLCLCFFIRDISSRREAEDALQQAHDELAQRVDESTRANQELQQEIINRKKIEDELLAAITRLQQHDEAKSEFISNVSHEFRTPLTSIKYMTDNMLRGIAGPVTDKTKSYLNMIISDCDRLARTVEDILDLSRIDADTLKMEICRIPFNRLVASTVESLRVQAEQAHIELYTHINYGAEFTTCDVEKMERVIINIVKNAIKFTPEGGHIDVVVETAPEYPDYLVLAVSDTGPGIPPEHIGHVTERYYRVGEYVSGTGLGLAICKELVEKHGGTLHLASPVPGRECGTQVLVMLPKAPPVRLAIVNAEKEVSSFLEQTLAPVGYELSNIHPELTLDHHASAIPDAILLDWTRQGMEAAAILVNLKDHQSLAECPVFVFTEQHPARSKHEIIEGFEIPALTFPCREETLLAILADITKEDCIVQETEESK